MKLKIFLYICLILLCFDVSYAQNTQSLSIKRTQKPLKISIMADNAPFSMLLPDGTPTGLHVELWELWSKTNNIPIAFKSAPLAQNIKDLKSHQVDFHAGLFINDERKAWADFSRPIHKVTSSVFFLGENVSFSALETTTQTVAVFTDSFQENYLQKNYPNLNTVRYFDLQKTVSSILNNEIQAIYAEVPTINAALGRMGLRGVLSISKHDSLTRNTYALIPKENQELVDLINQGIENIPISKLIALEKKWLPEEIPFFTQQTSTAIPSLTLSQQQWLKSHETFTIGIDSAAAPFEFIDSQGQHAGVSSDYIKFMEEKLNLKMRLTEKAAWSDVIKKAQLGEVDILPFVVKTKSREQFLSFTKPYLSLSIVAATRNDTFFIHNMDGLDFKKVGIIRGYPAVNVIRKNHPNIQIQEMDNIKQGLLFLHQNKLEAFIGNIATITYEMNKSKFHQLKIAIVTPYTFDISMAVRKGLEPLVPILNKALDTIDKKQKEGIIHNWLALQVNIGIDFLTFVAWSMPILTVLFFIIWYVFRSNKRMMFEITERKKVEMSLEKAKKIAELTNQSKDHFLANMSHEIRTPLNAVLGMSHLLENSGLNIEQTEYVEALKYSADSLLLLINDILDLSKIESGKFKIENFQFNLNELLDNIKAQASVKINSDKVEFVINNSKQNPDELIGDPNRLKQILINLISNASKFTEQGKITLSIELYKKRTNKATLHFSISDTGIGISSTHQKGLFETYNQLDSSITRQYGGTGLGLSISKKLCEMMQGKIWVESEIKKGSCFHFTIPFGYINNAQSSAIKIANIDKKKKLKAVQDKKILLLKNQHVLIVDDNKVNLIIAQKMLQQIGLHISSAENGMKALKMIESEIFDAVLMDIQMPIMDGYIATKKIREKLSLAELPVIALTANAMDEDKQKALDSGMNDHITKPIDIDTLINTLSKWILQKE